MEKEAELASKYRDRAKERRAHQDKDEESAAANEKVSVSLLRTDTVHFQTVCRPSVVWSFVYLVHAFIDLLVACTRLYKPLCRSVGPSVAVHEARDLWRSALFVQSSPRDRL